MEDAIKLLIGNNLKQLKKAVKIYLNFSNEAQMNSTTKCFKYGMST